MTEAPAPNPLGFTLLHAEGHTPRTASASERAAAAQRRVLWMIIARDRVEVALGAFARGGRRARCALVLEPVLASGRLAMKHRRILARCLPRPVARAGRRISAAGGHRPGCWRCNPTSALLSRRRRRP